MGLEPVFIWAGSHKSMTMQPMYGQEYFIRTSDLALATAISTLGVAIEATDQDDPRRTIFIFAKSDHLTDIVNRYWRGELLIEPQAYFNQLKVLKTRIYRH
jgi:hypothetical protein